MKITDNMEFKASDVKLPPGACRSCGGEGQIQGVCAPSPENPEGVYAEACKPCNGTGRAYAGRCADCRHWQPFKETTSDPDSAQFYARYYAIERNRLGLCSRILSKGRYDGDSFDEPAKETVAAVEDLSDACALRTGPEFGCVLFERKT